MARKSISLLYAPTVYLIAIYVFATNPEATYKVVPSLWTAHTKTLGDELPPHPKTMLNVRNRCCFKLILFRLGNWDCSKERWS